MEKFVKSTALISFLTLCSRIMGLVRDACIAMFLGTSIYTDAFVIAFRPYDLVRKMFSEGMLGVSFIPVFTREIATNGRSSARNLVFSLLLVLSLTSVVFMLMGLLLGPFLVSLAAPGFDPGSYEFALTLILLKLMLPYLLFIILTALFMGILNSFGNFVVPALAPVIFNLTMITFILCAVPFFDTPVCAVAVGVTAGGVLQVALQIPALKKNDLFQSLGSFRVHKKVWHVLKHMLPSMIGAASYQINIMIASFFASTLDEGSVSYLYFADRLVQFPLALFAVSAVTVFLPELSRKAAENDFKSMGYLYSKGICLVLFITIPAMAGLMALNESIVMLLFGRGMFDTTAVYLTSQCLFFLVSGLWAFACIRLFVTLHFAVLNVAIPFWSGVLSIGVNILLCAVLVKPLGVNGLAVSVSAAAAAAFVFLSATLPSKISLDTRAILVSACRSIFLSAIMFFLVKVVYGCLASWQENDVGTAAVTLLSIVCGAVFYLGTSLLISTPELAQLIDGIKKKNQ